MSFWYRFWCLLGPFWPPFWSLLAPKSSQVRSKTRLERLSSSKSRFSKKRAPCGPQHDFDPKTTPKTSQDRSKTAPRPPQDDLEELLFASSFSSSILVRLGSNLVSICTPLGAPKTTPKSIQKTPENHVAAKWPPRSLQDGPGSPTGCPQTPKRAPRTLPKAAPDPPRPS